MPITIPRMLWNLIPLLVTILLLSNVQAFDKNDFTPQKDVFKLNEGWKFVFEDFLNFEDVLQDTAAIPIQIPSQWNNIIWKGRKIDGTGYGTIYKKIKRSDYNSEELALSLRAVGMAYKVFANHQLIGQVGNPGRTIQESKPFLKSGIFSIPPHIANDLYLIVHISNFRHHNGGIWHVPLFGAEKVLRDAKRKHNAILLFILGAILLMALSQLYAFFLRKKELPSLYFGLICLCFIVQSSTTEYIVIQTFLPDLPWESIKKMEYGSVFAVGLANLLFVQSLYPRMVFPWLVKLITLLACTAIMIDIIASPRWSYYLILPFQCLTLGLGIYLCLVLIVAIRKKEKGARILFAGLTLTFLTVINDILLANYVIQTFPMVQYGMIVYIISLIVLLTRRYTNSLNEEEKLSKRLEIVNEELESRVEERTSALRHANEEQRQLMAVVAHDLKAPLNQILGLSELMERDIPGKAKKLNTLIQNVASDGKKLLQDLSDLRNFENPNLSIKPELFNLTAFIEEKCAEFESEASRKAIKLTTHGEQEIDLTTDKALLGRIIDNLISNAIKFSSEHSEVIIRSSSLKNYIDISIKDEGPGFTNEDKKRVFGKFQKLSARPTARENSTGLGLSIVKALVDKVCGQIQLISEAGMGAEFIITLPLKLRINKHRRS